MLPMGAHRRCAVDWGVAGAPATGRPPHHFLGLNSGGNCGAQLAEQMGCDVVQRDSRAAELAVLRQRVNELERAA